MNFLFDITNGMKQENYKLKIKTGKCKMRIIIHIRTKHCLQAKEITIQKLQPIEV